MSYKSPPKELPPGSHVIVYLRDSGGEKQELSVIQQKKEVKDYCKNYSLILVDTFEDVARSGTSTAKREEFDRMIDYCHHVEGVTGLLVWNFARFARNVNDAWYYKSDLRRRGIIVHSMTDEIPDGPYSQMIEVMIDISNEEKSRQTSRDSKRGLAQRTLAGYVPGGSTPPRGYRAVREIISSHRDGSPRIGTKWEIDPETAPLVTLAFRMRAEGKSIKEIINAPCGTLYKTVGGWTTFFRNKSYLGIGKCGKTQVPNHHPALVDQVTWDAVQEIRERIHRNRPGNLLHPKRFHSPSLLSGIAVCIHCGTPIIRQVSGAKSSKGGKWTAYLCGKKRSSGRWNSCEGRQIQADKTDAVILDTILNRVLQRDFALELIAQLRADLSDTTEADRQEQAIKQALANCERALSRLLDAIENTDSAIAKERLKERENERARLQFDLTIFESRRRAAQLEVSPEAMELAMAVWRGEIEEARRQNDVRTLQSLLRRFLTKIELGYKTARLWYTYPIEAFVDSRQQSIALRDRTNVNLGKQTAPWNLSQGVVV